MHQELSTLVHRLRRQNYRPLEIIKMIKNKGDMGLKESKEFFDNHLKNFPSPEDDERLMWKLTAKFLLDNFNKIQSIDKFELFSIFINAGVSYEEAYHFLNIIIDK